MGVNYNEIAKKYDLTRKENINTIDRFLKTVAISADINVLDFGCGTGNFTCAFKLMTNANVYGVEPSDGMREKAAEKNNKIVFKKGNHEYLPFEDSYFGFIYMTDVIHHVPDIDLMFTEINRVLKKEGHVCIVTESHEQLKSRFWVKYFPTTVHVEKERYPDISQITESAVKNGLTFIKNESTDSKKKHMISSEFIQLVENKGYSMFELIKDSDYTKGFAHMKTDYNQNIEVEYTHGETFIWLRK